MMLGKNIRFLRRKNGWSQDYLAERLGYKSYTTIQKWESGVTEPPLKKAHAIAELFQIDIDDLTKKDLAAQEENRPYLAGSNIKQARLHRRTTQKELAEAVGTTKSTIRSYEAGYREPSVEAMQRIADALNVDFPEIIEEGNVEKILSAFRKLNCEGQAKAVERVEELTEVPKYQRESKLAHPHLSEREETDFKPHSRDRE